MTCIVTRYPTKKSLKEAVARSPASVLIEDPSIVNPRMFTAADILPGELVFVTNHPKRSWFAQVGRSQAGQLVVK